MAQGYGYGGEGRLEGRRNDRYTEGHGRGQATAASAFMEDYTYQPRARGQDTASAPICWRSARPWPPPGPRVEVHPLGIGMTDEDRLPAWSLRATRVRPSS